MATSDTRLHIKDRMTLTTVDLEDNFFNFLYKQSRDLVAYNFPSSGKISGTAILSSSTINTFSMSALEGLWEDGYWATLSAQTDIPFENSNTIWYHVGVKFIEVAGDDGTHSGCVLNEKTNFPDYVYKEEQVGELENPTQVLDNGSNLYISVSTLTDPVGVSYVGRTVRAYMTYPVAVSDNARHVGIVGQYFGINTGVNDTFKIRVDTGSGWGASQSVIFVDGAYSASAISTAINDVVTGVTCSNDGSGYVQIESDSIGVVKFEIEAIANDCYSTLGLTAGVYVGTSWYEDCVIQYGDPGFGSNQNYIETVSLLGQTVGSVSTTVTDYQCWLQGLSVFRNKDLSDRPTYPEYLYLGRVQGNGGTPTVFDYTNVDDYGAASSLILDYLRDFVGKQTSGAEMPSYASLEIVSQGDDLVGAISDLDLELETLNLTGGVIAESFADRAESMARSAESIGVVVNSHADVTENAASEAVSYAYQISPEADSIAQRAESIAKRSQEMYLIRSTNPLRCIRREPGDFVQKGTTPLQVKRWDMQRTGELRIQYTLKAITVGAAFAEWSVNGVTQQIDSTASVSYVTFTIDLTIANASDYIALEVYSSSAGGFSSVEDIRFLVDNPTELILSHFATDFPDVGTLPPYTANTTYTDPNMYLEAASDGSKDTINSVWSTVKVLRTFRPIGVATVYLELRTNNGGITAEGRLYVTGPNITPTYIYSDDFPYWTYSTSYVLRHYIINDQDAPVTISIQLRSGNSSFMYSAYVQNVRLYCNVPSQPLTIL